jgi:hypothetical protein
MTGRLGTLQVADLVVESQGARKENPRRKLLERKAEEKRRISTNVRYIRVYPRTH